MTDQTPATESGRRLLYLVGNGWRQPILAIEAEARATMPNGGVWLSNDAYGDLLDEAELRGRAKGRADALREAADAVRDLSIQRDPPSQFVSRAAVLAILDPQP
jgi:hypothetical protein